MTSEQLTSLSQFIVTYLSLRDNIRDHDKILVQSASEIFILQRCSCVLTVIRQNTVYIECRGISIDHKPKGFKKNVSYLIYNRLNVLHNTSRKHQRNEKRVRGT